MSGFDSGDRFESAWRDVAVATERAEKAESAAERAAVAAARQERLAASDSPAAGTHARIARAHRASERCQRATASLQRDYASLMAGWAARHDPDSLARPGLVNAVARVMGWRDALLSVRDHRGGEKLVAASGATARRAHELEVILGEGPSWESERGRHSRVAGRELVDRWPRYGGEVARLGVHAVATVPLPMGSDLLGALTLTGPVEGEYGSSRLADIAAALRQCLLSAPELMDTGQAQLPNLGQFVDQDFQPALHQAAGALHERTGLPLNDATDLIRAHAYAEDRSVADVAVDVLRGSVIQP